MLFMHEDKQSFCIYETLGRENDAIVYEYDRLIGNDATS